MAFWKGVFSVLLGILGIYMATRGGGWFFPGLITIIIAIALSGIFTQ